VYTSVSGNGRYKELSQEWVPWEVATSQPIGILDFTSHRGGVCAWYMGLRKI